MISAEQKKVVVLFSGGLDSTTTLAIARNKNCELYALTFRYGQKHSIEVEAAKDIAEQYDVKKHMVIDLDFSEFSHSALTDSQIDVPKNRTLDEMCHGIPVTYVPARNTLFLSYALAFAETLKANEIYMGVNAVDYSGYPDCRPDYIAAFEKMAILATKAGIEGQRLTIQTPLIHMTKAQIIAAGIELGVDYSKTRSCYDPSPEGLACGACDSCLLRAKGFSEAGISDPTRYA